MTFPSISSFACARAKTSSSTVLDDISRKTLTSFFCPIRWALNKSAKPYVQINDSPILSLQIGMRIPISIVTGYQLRESKSSLSSLHDDGIGRLKIKTQTTSSGGEDENLIRRIWIVESR